MSNTHVSKIQIGTLNYVAQQRAKISVLAALVADLIFQLQQNPNSSNPGWCRISNAELGETFSLSARSIVRLLAELTGKGFIETNYKLNDKRCLRTTGDYYRAFVALLSEDNSATPNLHGSLSDDNSATPNLHGSLSDDNSATPNLHGSLSEDNSATPNLHGNLSDDNSATPNLHGNLSDDNAETLENKELLISTVPNLDGRNQNANFADSTLVESNNNNTIVDNKEEDKILCAKTKKNEASHGSKFPAGFFAKCRSRYETLRQSLGWTEEYYFNAREVGSLRNLINAIAHSTKCADAQGNHLPVNYDEVYRALDEFFTCLPARMLQQPVSISQMYSSYNEIISEQASKNRLHSHLVQGILDAFKMQMPNLPAEYVATDAERRAALQVALLLSESARSKTPDCPAPTDEQLLTWCSNLFKKINKLEWWALRTGSIAFVVKNYNSIVAAIKQAATPTPAAVNKTSSGKIIPEHGTEISWKNPAAAAIFGRN